MTKKVKQVRGFVMNRKTGHISYAFRQHYDNVDSIGFTHNFEDRAEKIKLKHNIDPNDKRDCYVKTKVEKQRYNTYRKKKEYANNRIHSEDKSIIDYIITNDNKKRR